MSKADNHITYVYLLPLPSLPLSISHDSPTHHDEQKLFLQTTWTYMVSWSKSRKHKGIF